MRTCKSVQEYSVHQDFIADLHYHNSTLLGAGGDGLLSVHDVRNPTEKIKFSEDIEDELLSMTVLNNGKKVVAGSQSGALYMWDWNRWDTPKKWIGHPSSVDTICKLDENAICTGASDGLLRMISIAPQNFEGVLGDHGQDFPIECVKLDHQHKYLASCGHDLQLRFWNVHFLFEEDQQAKGTKRIEREDNMDEPKTKRTRGQFFDQML